MFNALPRLIIEVWSRQIPLKTSLPKQTCLIIIVSKYWLLEVKYFSEDDDADDDDGDGDDADDDDGVGVAALRCAISPRHDDVKCKRRRC